MAERTVDLIIRARDTASQAFQNLNGALEELTGIQQKVARGAELMSNAVSGSEQDIRALAKALESGDALKARDAFKQVGDAVDRMGARLREQQAEVQSNRQAYVALAAQLEKARTALRGMNEAIGPRSQQDTARIKATEQAIRDLSKESRAAEKNLDRSQAKLDEMSDTYRRVSNAAGVYESALRDLKQRQDAATSAGSGDMRRIANEYRQAAAAAEQKARAARVTADEQQRLSASFRRAASPLRSLAQGLRQSVSAYRQAAQGAQQFAGAARQAGTSARWMEGEVIGARRALAAFYGDSRRALSLMQRMRGEVLSLTAGFVGFYGVFEQGRAVVQSFQAMEAAVNRMEAAVGGNVELAARELGFLRTEADRLGFSFETLSTTYSSFLISGQAAGLELAQVRDIFVSVSEASRVLGLDQQRVGRVFTALTQIAGKGTVQMEELRQQLGDNLPGAVGILARSLGYAEDELDEFYRAVEQGNIGAEEGLLALAQGLDETFGGQLEASLETVNAQIGRLQNNLFNRRLTAGQGGLIDGLESLLDALNEFLSSEEGIDFFARMGAAAGRFLETLPGIFENLDKIALAIKALVAFKLAQLIQGWAVGFGAFVSSMAAVPAALVSTSAAMLAVPAAGRAVLAGTTTAAGGFVALGRAAVALTVALRGLMGLLLGPVGFVALAAVSFAAVDGFAATATEVETTNRSLIEHQRIIDTVRAAYNEANQAGADWMERLRNDAEGLTESEVRAAVIRARETAQELSGGLLEAFMTEVGTFDFTQFEFEGLNFDIGIENGQELERILSTFDPATGDINELDDALTALADRMNNPAFDEFSASLIEQARKTQEAEGRLEEFEALLAVMERTATEAERALIEGAVAVGELGDSMDAEVGSLDNFAAALGRVTEGMDSLRALVPSMRDAVRLGQDIARVEAEYQERVQEIMALPAGEFSEQIRADLVQEAQQLRDQAIQEINAEAAQRRGVIGRGFDGVPESASIPVTRGGGYTPANADIEDIVRRSVEAVIGPEGEIVFTSGLRANGRTSSQHYAGNAVDFAVRRPDGSQLSWDDPETQEIFAMAARMGALGFGAGPNYMRGSAFHVDTGAGGPRTPRRSGVTTWSDDDGTPSDRGPGAAQWNLTLRQAAEEGVQFERERAEAHGEYREGLQAELEDAEFRAELQNQDVLTRETALALREAEQRAAELGIELTDQEREIIAETVRLRHASTAAAESQRGTETERNAEMERGRQLEAEVTRLQERRAFLQEEIAFQQNQGNTEQVAALQAELATVNSELDAAIQRAIQFWEALGGPGAAQAQQALRQTQAELQRTGQVTVTTGEQMNNMIANKLTGAISNFVRRVAEGEDAWTAFKEEFLRAIGEMLIEIGTLIIRQAILNALQGGQGPNGGVGGGIAGMVNGLFHSGGIVGHTPTSTRTVNPAVFANAVRYHSGGMVGLRPNEVAAVLEEGEEVLTENDPRHRRNFGGAQGPTIINAFDAPGFLDAALAQNGDAMLNFVRANRESVKAALE